MIPSSPAPRHGRRPIGSIYVVSADESRRLKFQNDLAGLEPSVHLFRSGGELVAVVSPESVGCVLLDPRLPDMAGFELVEALASRSPALVPVVAVEKPSLPAVVKVMRVGAYDVLEAPVPADRLEAAVSAACELSAERAADLSRRRGVEERVSRLTVEQREVLDLALQGLPNKAIADRKSVSVRTIERLRAAAFDALGVSTLTEAAQVLVRVCPNPSVRAGV